jgi:hypothetical protein
MIEIDGKIIFKVQNTNATVIDELSESEKNKLLEAEMEPNDRVSRDLYRKYGIAIRVHL